ncbi:MAG TPA: 2-oxoacid:acceptor oxidoreductase family protein [Dehalococcoidales bacterium]|nr:2-oxoacid:acceptor oxidoreductase family protein [Dehalococcoidales bacterium]
MVDINQLVEIRWHGRGGQGAVTSAELLARAAIDEGKYAQAFPSFGPERRGAPVLSFVRVDSQQPIRNRAGIQEPDVVVVLDTTLLAITKITAGLKADGIVVINTRKPVAELRREFGINCPLATVDATTIAREVLGIPITNTTMLGALVKATGIVKLESLEEPLKQRFGRLAERNIAAMKRAYQETLVEG